MPWQKVDRREFLFYSMLPALQGLNPNRDGSKPPENPVMYAPARSQHGITNGLPAGLAAAIANPSVTHYKVAPGRYRLTSDLGINRSNFDLDFGGSSLIYTPSDTSSAFQCISDRDEFVDPASPHRDASHLTGTVTTGTTQLTMDAAEIMDVTPGEVVTLVLGVSSADPVEGYRSIVATVASVNGAVITFTAALGVNVPTYASQAAFKATIDPSLWEKVGFWGEDYNDAAYMKGLGFDHGLLRFVGGMYHDITIRNFHLEITIPPDADIPVSSGQTFFFQDMSNLIIKNWSAMNIVMAPIHTNRCYNVLVDKFELAGTARAALFSAGTTVAGHVMTSWFGENILYRNGRIRGKNFLLANTEGSPDITFENVQFTSTIFDDWSYGAGVVVLGFYGSNPDILLKNCTLALNTSTGQYSLDSGAAITFENLIISGTVFPDYFDFALHIITGTFTIAGVTYAAKVTDNEIVTRTATVNGARIYTPKGFYRSLRFRVTTPGSALDMADGHGNHYDASVTNGQWTSVYTNWTKPTQGQTPAAHFSEQWFDFHFSGGGGGASVVVEFDAEYYPAPDNLGWTLS